MKFKTKFIAFFSLPILVVLVASLQLYRTETTNLSRWKGGGFGMYTDINEAQNVVVVNNEVFKINALSGGDFISHETKLNFLLNANNKTATDFYQSIKSPTDTTNIQIYQPVVDVKKNTMTYKLVYEKLFIKDKSSR